MDTLLWSAGERRSGTVCVTQGRRIEAGRGSKSNGATQELHSCGFLLHKEEGGSTQAELIFTVREAFHDLTFVSKSDRDCGR